MATLILTTLGSALGGPIGGALGALAGQAIDNLIFRPDARSGPRLSDLQVQTSRYGARIPSLYGATRVAGTVIWSTDLQESRSTTGGGKGQPDVTRFSYSASFAVALSSRPIQAVGRIWADGNLLRGSAGDFKTPVTAFRLHKGLEGQSVDPLIAADMGVGQTPAYRGCGYAVFEGLQLADFGNRIPSLTFEIFADDGPAGITAIVSDLAAQDIPFDGDEEEPSVVGFAAEGNTLRDAVEDMLGTYRLRWRERDGAIALVAAKSSDRVLAASDEVRSADGEALSSKSKQREAVESLPRQLAIRHYDPDRDFQLGIQTTERSGPGERSEEIGLPVVIGAADARRLADRSLRAAMRGRTTVRRAMSWAALDLSIGDVVSMEDEPGRWLVEACDWEGQAVRLQLRAVEVGTRAAIPAGTSGAPVLQADLVQGATILSIVELPPTGISLVDAPTVFAAATGDDAGWRRAALFRYRADLEAAEPIGGTAASAVTGVAATVLQDGKPWRIDRRSSVEVVLHDASDVLSQADDAALLDGTNLCQIGDELLQYANVELVGPRRYRLSHFVRGRQGTEWACALHLGDEPFVLIDPTHLTAVETDRSQIAQLLELRAIGSGDLVPAEASRLIDGRAMMPVSPVHGKVLALPGGDLSIGWIRRSRLGWTWGNGGDVPLAEERELYLLRAVADGLILREWEANGPLATYAAAAFAEDLAAAGSASLQIEVRQKGMWGLSRPLVLDLV
jgi:hypothetical protein